jgi:hypothetical protein
MVGLHYMPFFKRRDCKDNTSCAAGLKICRIQLSRDELRLEGKRDEALSNLEFAFAHQAKSDLRQGVEKDEDLRSLRGDVRFVALAAKAQQGLAAAAKN